MEILVYAKIGGRKHYLGVYDEITEIQKKVDEFLDFNGKISWSPYVYFLMNGEEYKLYLEDEK